MISRRTSSVRSRQARQRMLSLKVSSPRIVLFDLLKIGASALKVVVALGLAVFFGFLLSFGWKKLFVENDEFIVKDIPLKNFEGEDARFLTHERLMKETQLDNHATIFSIDTDQLRDTLLELPEITSAKVSRRLPGTLKIEVAERTPVAWLACRALGIPERDREKGLLVDQHNIPFRCASDVLWDYAQKLPVVMVPRAGAGEVTIGEPVTHKGLNQAFDLVALSETYLADQHRPAWVIVEDEITLQMKTMGGTYATLSYYGLERQLASLSRSFRHAETQGKAIAKINLIPKRFVPVRYHSF